VLLDTIWRDIRFAFRSFRRAPATALTVVATLAVSLGLNATAFSVFNAYVLRPAAVRDADSLHLFTWLDRLERAHRFTWQEYEQLRRETTGVFSDVAAAERLGTRINYQPVRGLLVTGNYFSMLGVPAALGRVLTPGDAAVPGRERAVVLSHSGWERLFAGDPTIVGRQMKIQNLSVEVIGVAAKGFVGLDIVPQDFWAPLTLSGLVADGPNLFGPEQPQRLEVTGHLRPEHTKGSAEAALMIWARRITADRPADERVAAPILLSAATPIPFSFEVGLAFAPVAFAFGLVLLTAAANIAGLMLSRAVARQKEISIRLSLGATRGHIVRQFLTEALLMAVAATVAGFALARVTLGLGVRLLFATLPAVATDYIRLLPLPPDLRVFGFMLVAGFLAALLFGAVPAFQATRGRMTMKAHGGSTSDPTSSRLRHGLVVAQITVSALLVVTSGVLLRGAIRLAGTDLGLRTRNVIQIRTHDRSSTTAPVTLASNALVRGMGVTSQTLFDMGSRIRVTPADGTGAQQDGIAYRFASPEYFTVLDIPIVSGRSFTDVEARAESPVVILSQSAAERLWPRQNPVGRTVRLAPGPQTREGARPIRYPIAEVIGVGRDVATSWEAKDRALVYLPTSAGAQGNPVLLVRAAGDEKVARRQLETALTVADPGSVDQIITLDDLAAARIYPFHAAYWLAGAVGALALLLTTSGIYGVLSYAVARRTKEIGIRMALGATTGTVLTQVLGQSLRMCAAGLTLGTMLALGTSKLLSSALVMMDAFDALAFASGIAVVLTVCMAAAFYPARRAARIEPLVALRIE
jgi:predicted permease